MSDLRYPLGAFDMRMRVVPEMREPAMAAIADLPARLGAAVRGLSEGQVDTPYRPGGWTVRQLVHHIGDSHANAYIRTKLALTELEPVIKPYNQEAWALLPDSRLPIEESLPLIEAIHAHWTALWRSLAPDQFGRTFNHPENGIMTLDTQLQLYAWHSRHHVAHITALRQREGW